MGKKSKASTAKAESPTSSAKSPSSPTPSPKPVAKKSVAAEKPVEVFAPMSPEGAPIPWAAIPRPVLKKGPPIPVVEIPSVEIPSTEIPEVPNLASPAVGKTLPSLLDTGSNFGKFCGLLAHQANRWVLIKFVIGTVLMLFCPLQAFFAVRDVLAPRYMPTWDPLPTAGFAAVIVANIVSFGFVAMALLEKDTRPAPPRVQAPARVHTRASTAAATATAAEKIRRRRAERAAL